MADKTFSAQLKGIRDKTVANMRYVASQAIQDVIEAAQTPQLAVTKGAEGYEVGKVPVAEADLINSLVTRISSGGEAEGQASYATVIAGFEIGDRIEFEWTQEYAMRIEEGFSGTDAAGREYNQAGRHFVGHNAANFSEYVAARVKEVQG